MVHWLWMTKQTLVAKTMGHWDAVDGGWGWPSQASLFRARSFAARKPSADRGVPLFMAKRHCDIRRDRDALVAKKKKKCKLPTYVIAVNIFIFCVLARRSFVSFRPNDDNNNNNIIIVGLRTTGRVMWRYTFQFSVI